MKTFKISYDGHASCFKNLNEKVEAETKGQLIQNLLDVAPYLDDESLLKKICTIQDLDYDEVVQSLGSQDYGASKRDVIDNE